MVWILLGAVAILIVSFLVIWNILAPSNLWFTFVKEGTAKIVVKGDKFEKALIQWEGYTFDKDWNVISNGTVINGKIYKEPWHPFGGLRYYGLWPIQALYGYQFEWTGMKENSEVQFHPKEWFDYILFKDDVYWCKVEKAKDKSLLPLNIELLLTIRIVNPYKVLFVTQNWLEVLLNSIRLSIQDYVARKTFENLIIEGGNTNKEMWKKLDETGKIKEFKDKYGVDLKEIAVKSINPEEEYREATLKKYLAERERDKVVTEADAERQRLEIVAQGEVVRIKAVYEQIQKLGDVGNLVRALEAMEKSPLAASVIVQTIPGFQETLREIFGKASEKVTTKEIKKLREMIKKFQKEKERNSTES